jgi:phage terminase small subunit
VAKNDTSRYELFAAFYVGEAQFNATEAAIMAGFKGKDRHSIQVQASEALKREDVQAFIRKHVSNAKITQDELLEEMANMARWSWQDNITNVASMEEAKVFDTMMRAKVKSVSDLMKLFSSEMQQELTKVRRIFEDHRTQHPEISDEQRAELFKQHIDPKMVDELMRELLANDANKQRLVEMEAEVENPMAGGQE